MQELPSLKSVIQKFNLTPKKNLGQNFLLNSAITDRIVDASLISSNDEVLEIGPGPGGLTRSILKKHPKKLIVIEQDSRCIAALKELNLIYPQLEIINDDALKIDYSQLGLNNPKIIANLPYNIGTALLLKWLETPTLWSSLTLMFQREVAERIAALPKCKDYGRLSVISQIICNIEKHFELEPKEFFPPPKVTSTVISIYPKQNQLDIKIIKNVEMICKILFNQRRKMLRSTLSQVSNNIQMLLENTGIELSQRPEEISVEQFVMLAKNYKVLNIH